MNTNDCKFDAFKVRAGELPPPDTDKGEIDVLKFCDANANGVLDPAEFALGLQGWQINFSPDPVTACSGTTDVNGLLACTNRPINNYTVSEVLQASFAQTATCVDGFCGICTDTVTPCNATADCSGTDTCTVNGAASALIAIEGGDIHTVDFGNVGLGAISGRKTDALSSSGIDGKKILLSGPVNLCTTTSGGGYYSFPALLPGSYTVTETPLSGVIAIGPAFCSNIEIAVDATCTANQGECNFSNVCTGAGGGLTLGFWSNKNGYTAMNDGGSVSSELTLLSGLNLRNAGGSDFNPTCYCATGACPPGVSANVPVACTAASAFRSWILNANAINMAYMLSAQLAAMELNVEAGFVSNGSTVYAPGCGNSGPGNNFITIANLMSAANTQLGNDGDTPAGDPNRATQECLKNALDNANNNTNFVVTCNLNESCS